MCIRVALDAQFIKHEMGNQVRVNRDRRVNEQVTGPYAGASTSYNTSAPQMSAELSQQIIANEVNRVNTNLRAGQLTGQKTNLADHRGMTYAATQQAAFSALSRVNEQARGGVFTGVSTAYNLDSEEMRNYKRNQEQTSSANRERGLMLGDIGTDGANADAGYHHAPADDYIEIGSKFKLSDTMKGRFEGMMGNPDGDSAAPVERARPPARKNFSMEKPVASDSPTSGGRRQAEL